MKAQKMILIMPNLKIQWPKKLIFIISVVCLSSCDFAPTLDKSILEAQRAIEKSDYKRAIRINDEILNKAHKQEIKRKVLYQQGEIYLIHLNDEKNALKYYSQLYKVETDPYWQVKVLEKMADINFYNLRHFEISAKYYLTLTEFKPALRRYDYYKFQLAKSNLNAGNYVEAMKILMEISEDPRNQYQYDSYYQIGLINFYKKNWAEAINNFKSYIANSSSKETIVHAKFLIANCYETQERLREAYNIYYSILDTFPNVEVIRARLKSLYERRQNRKR